MSEEFKIEEIVSTQNDSLEYAIYAQILNFFGYCFLKTYENWHPYVSFLKKTGDLTVYLIAMARKCGCLVVIYWNLTKNEICIQMRFSGLSDEQLRSPRREMWLSLRIP